ncbi:MAG: DUF2326 domain-containing protein [Nannocystis sp.]|nr:DUF2326 domain-containing protein [Nannocystis sp.]
MKLVRLYSNHDDVFVPLTFSPGVNVVLGTIHDPARRVGKNTHNLGKSTLARVIDYCLLQEDPRAIFQSATERFADFIFYLEIDLWGERRVLVRRHVSGDRRTSIWVADGTNPAPDGRRLEAEEWTHGPMGEDLAKSLLNRLLDITGLAPYSYRALMGYLLRDKEDYADKGAPFKLAHHMGAEHQWRIPMAQMLGLPGAPWRGIIEANEQLNDTKAQLQNVQRELRTLAGDQTALQSQKVALGVEIAALTRSMGELEFAEPDQAVSRDLVQDTEGVVREYITRITDAERTAVRIAEMLERDAGATRFKPRAVATLFEQAGVVLPGELLRTHADLIAFYRAVTTERREQLKQELAQVELALIEMRAKHAEADARRASLARSLANQQLAQKYRDVAERLAKRRVEQAALERALSIQPDENRLTRERDRLKARLDELKADAQTALSPAPELLRQIQQAYGEITRNICGDVGVLSVTTKPRAGTVTFDATFRSASGRPNDKHRGETYSRLRSIAFDLALLQGRLPDRWPQFVYHDSILNLMEPRLAQGLLCETRKAADAGIQSVITLLEHELDPLGGLDTLDDDTIVLRLHDGGAGGRLFRGEEW